MLLLLSLLTASTVSSEQLCDTGESLKAEACLRLLLLLLAVDGSTTAVLAGLVCSLSTELCMGTQREVCVL